jgi:ketosteroid isomerase-like protein
MKIISKIASSLLAAGLLAVAGCSTPQDTNTAVTTATATPEATPDTAGITAEVTRIEKDWPRVLKEKDAGTARKMEADDILLVYPEGNTGGKEEDIKDIEAGNLTFDAWDISDINVKVLDANAAVVSFRLAVTNGTYKSSDGAAQNISGHYIGLDTFARRNGQWQIVASSVIKLSAAVEQSLKANSNATASPAASPAAKASPAVKASPVTKASPAVKSSPVRRASPAAARTP